MKSETIYVTNNFKEYLNKNSLEKYDLHSQTINHFRKYSNTTCPLIVCDFVAYKCDATVIKNIKKTKLKKGDKNYG
jgi:hypothetical protein